MFEVLCINDVGRPNEIPSNRWIKKNQIYTVIECMKCNVQGGLLGYKLEEINIDDCVPYKYFAANRFTVLTQAPSEKIEEEQLIEI
jgi:hypothetical protein